jgi:PKD repeat protein
MKRIITFFSALGLLVSINLQGQNVEQCLAEVMFREAAAKDPSLWQKREQLEMETRKYIESTKNQPQALSSVKRVIPVVVHVLYENCTGSENISDAQIKDQIRILNEDFSLSNPDTNKIPGPFKPLAANLNIEFRLANIDPSGNCTNGIVRKQTPLSNTANPRDGLKAVSYWDSRKYLNIWVVKSIFNNGGAGTVLGYAQFPGGSAATDGIVLRSDVVGSIGTAGWNNKGRTASHEVGHWLNLRHIWGDDGTACTGSDLVNDTPNQGGQNSGCPAFPRISCSNGPDGDMYMNYMDYTNGSCQYMFSLGQKSRMDAVLAGARAQLISTSNLIATGVEDGHVETKCTPKADFCFSRAIFCEGTQITFTDKSWRGTPVSWKWLLPGSDSVTAVTQNPTVKYLTAGTYDVTLIVSGDTTGSDTLFLKDAIHVVPSTAQNTLPFTDSFEYASFPVSNWHIIDEPSDGVFWSLINTSSASGASCMKLNNFNAAFKGNSHSLISPPIDFTNASNPVLTFKTAYATKSSPVADELKIYYSFNCGITWLLAKTYTASSLSAGLMGSSFVPNAGNWSTQTLTLPPGVLGKSNLMFKFEFNTGGGGNNFYLDDVNITTTVGINQSPAPAFGYSVSPNPASGGSVLYLELVRTERVTVKVYDILGKEVKNILENQPLQQGRSQYSIAPEHKGVYFIRMQVGDHISTHKLVIN